MAEEPGKDEQNQCASGEIESEEKERLIVQYEGASDAESESDSCQYPSEAEEDFVRDGGKKLEKLQGIVLSD